MKKLMAFLLALTMLVSLLTACGGPDESDNKTKNRSNVENNAENNAENNGDGEMVEVHLVSTIINYGHSYAFAYDEKGNMTDCAGYGSDDAKLEYDEDHKITKRSWYRDGELRNYAQYIYDEQGMLVKEERYSKTGELGTTWVSVYNAQGLLTEHKSVAPNGDVGMSRFYTYNEEGLLIEEKEVFYEDVNYRDTYSYDEQGRCVEYYRYTGSDKVSKHMLYTYDASGKLLTEENTAGGKSTLVYNAEGQLVEENYEGSKNRQYIYTYDDNGNLIKKDRSENGVAESPAEYHYITLMLPREEAKAVLENMRMLLEEQGLAPLQR